MKIGLTKDRVQSIAPSPSGEVVEGALTGLHATLGKHFSVLVEAAEALDGKPSDAVAFESTWEEHVKGTLWLVGTLLTGQRDELDGVNRKAMTPNARDYMAMVDTYLLEAEVAGTDHAPNSATAVRMARLMGSFMTQGWVVLSAPKGKAGYSVRRKARDSFYSLASN